MIAPAVARDIGDYVAHAADDPVPAPDQVGDQARPARLVACAKTGAVIALEVLTEQQVVPPGWVGAQRLCPAEARPVAGRVKTEDGDQPVGKIGRDDVKRQLLGRSRGILDWLVVDRRLITLDVDRVGMLSMPG